MSAPPSFLPVHFLQKEIASDAESDRLSPSLPDCSKVPIPADQEDVHTETYMLQELHPDIVSPVYLFSVLFCQFHIFVRNIAGLFSLSRQICPSDIVYQAVSILKLIKAHFLLTPVYSSNSKTAILARSVSFFSTTTPFFDLIRSPRGIGALIPRESSSM